MNRARQIFAWAVNALSLLVLVAGVIVLTKNALLDGNATAPASMAAVSAGETLSLPVPEDPERRTLVLALSTDCPYCRASLPFYRRVSALSDKRMVRTLALFPSSERIGSEYLASERLTVDFVRQADLSALGIVAVPTVVLVDAKGRIEQTWTGKLSDSQEKQLLEQLRSASAPVRTAGSGFRGTHLLSLEAFLVEKATPEGRVILDTRTRDDFAKAHLAGARSLPADEVPVRARIELAPETPVLLYCDDGRPGSRRPTISGARTLCGASVLLLELSGIKQVRVLDANLDEARNAGADIRASSFLSLPPRTLGGRAP